MNSKILKLYLNVAPQNSMITIYDGTGRPKEFIKENIKYIFDEDKTTLIIGDKTTKRLHLLSINYIRNIQIDNMKFKPMSWFDGAKEGENKTEV